MSENIESVWEQCSWREKATWAPAFFSDSNFENKRSGRRRTEPFLEILNCSILLIWTNAKRKRTGRQLQIVVPHPCVKMNWWNATYPITMKAWKIESIPNFGEDASYDRYTKRKNYRNRRSCTWRKIINGPTVTNRIIVIKLWKNYFFLTWNLVIRKIRFSSKFYLYKM